jgi:ADP-ribose pyrophosphatase YjhB (NUDIX family)
MAELSGLEIIRFARVVVHGEPSKNVLLLQVSEPEEPTWGLPEGFLEPGTEIQAGAAQVLRQATGINVRPHSLRELRADHVLDPAKGHVFLEFLFAVAVEGEPAVRRSANTGAARWLGIQAAQELVVQNTRNSRPALLPSMVA